jgi:hypothetical protein
MHNSAQSSLQQHHPEVFAKISATTCKPALRPAPPGCEKSHTRIKAVRPAQPECEKSHIRINVRFKNIVNPAQQGGRNRLSCAKIRSNSMAFYVFYVIAIVVLILHFTGWLKRNNLEWLILVLAASVFPVVIFLR